MSIEGILRQKGHMGKNLTSNYLSDHIEQLLLS